MGKGDLRPIPRASRLRRLVGLGLLALGAMGWAAWGPQAIPATAAGLPKLVISPSVMDLGTIHKTGGKVVATFTLQNDGTAPLRIQRIVPT